MTNKKHKFQDIIDPSIKFSCVESNEVDGEHILAKIRGQFFVPDGTSRNGRYYSKSLWERVLGESAVKSKLVKRLMFGTIGHDGDISEKGIRDGNASHIMTAIEIDGQNRGMGEAFVLNTPAGRILNTILRAGSQLSVSSRATGTFKGKRDGVPMVDEDTYELEGWDFVIDPGFLEANPAIAESLENLIEGDDDMENNNRTTTKEFTMDERLVKHITDENADLKKQVGDLIDESEALKEDKKTLEEENTHVKTEMEKLVEANKELEAYKVLGTVAEITESIASGKKASETVAAYEELADSPEEAKKAFEIADKFMSNVSEKFGSVEDISKVFEAHTSLVKEIEEIGTLEQIKKCLEGYEKVLEEKETNEQNEKVKALATELNLSEEKISELLGKYSEEDVRTLYKTVSEAKTTDSTKYKKQNFDESKTTDKKDEDDKDLSESTIIGKSRIDRINERLMK